MRKNLYWPCVGRNWPCNWNSILGYSIRRQKIPAGVSIMFCPKCGTLSFPTPSGHMTCTNFKCGYSGNASNPIYVHGKEIDVSRVSTDAREELTRGHREFGTLCLHSGMSLVFAFSQPNLGNVRIADLLTCVFEVAKKNVWTVDLTFLNPTNQAIFMEKWRQRSMRLIRRLTL